MSYISIHATHTGGDLTTMWPCLAGLFQSTPPIRVATIGYPKVSEADRYFNPRHPYGWRPYRVFAPPSPNRFQSTPPIRVATWAAGQMLQAYLISIHATHTGGDCQGIAPTPHSSDFNPRHPYGWRPGFAFPHTAIGVFQSTPPIRVATLRGNPM